MDLEALSPALGLLRARIEAGIERPAVLSVTSARPRDGKSLLSYGLAANFAETDYKVLFVDADGSVSQGASTVVRKLSDDPAFDVSAYVRPGGGRLPDMLNLSGPGVAESGSINAIRAAFERFRKQYDYTLIDMPVLASSSLALLLSAASDGVIVAVRSGRSIRSADKDIPQLLRTASANFVGAVTVDARAIRSFRTTPRQRDAKAVLQVHGAYEETLKRASQAEVAS